MLFIAIGGLLLSACNAKNDTEDTVPESRMQTSSHAAAMGTEIADLKYIDIGKKYLAAFSRGDVDEWLGIFAENAVFLWNNGDSLNGKEAIAAYWRDRWAKLDSIRFSNDIWLPVQVNQPQSIEQPGLWLYGWYQFDATYKGNKRVTQWAHDDIHFDANGKVDRLIHYVDMAPIRKVIAGK